MRIIAAGIAPPKEWKQKCRKCGTLFAYTEADIIRDCNLIETPVDSGIRLVCPVCSEWLKPVGEPFVPAQEPSR
jgi:hypothetical protein